MHKDHTINKSVIASKDLVEAIKVCDQETTNFYSSIVDSLQKTALLKDSLVSLTGDNINELKENLKAIDNKLELLQDIITKIIKNL